MNTLTRCALAAVATAAFMAPVCAQVQRNFPPTALRGEVVFSQPPVIVLNGQQARLAPGARIRDEANLLQLSGTLMGRRAMVHYTLEPLGLVLDVWLLTPQELANKPWPSTPKQAQEWDFDPAAQVWTPR